MPERGKFFQVYHPFSSRGSGSIPIPPPLPPVGSRTGFLIYSELTLFVRMTLDTVIPPYPLLLHQVSPPILIGVCNAFTCQTARRVVPLVLGVIFLIMGAQPFYGQGQILIAGTFKGGTDM